jgi:hypothetical protein
VGSCAYGKNADFPAVGSTPGGGTYIFHASVSPAVVTQTIDVSGAAPEIDAGKAQANLQADLGGWNGQDDQGRYSVTYLSGSNATLGTLEAPRVSGADRNYQTVLVRRNTAGQIPAGTRSIRATLTLEGAGSNDGYADNLMLSLSEYVAPPPPPPPPPPPTTTTTTPAPTPTPATPPRTPPRNPDTPTGPPPPAFGRGGVFQGLPSNRRCLSRRNFRIRARRVRGYRMVTWSVFVNRRRVAVRNGRRVTAPVDLRGLPRGRYTVRIVGLAQTGDIISDTRRYRTCVPRGRRS